MRRLLVMLSVTTILIAASAVPAFAAKPSGFFVECEDGASVFILGEPSQVGGAFGQINSAIAQGDSQGCERGPFRL